VLHFLHSAFGSWHLIDPQLMGWLVCHRASRRKSTGGIQLGVGGGFFLGTKNYRETGDCGHQLPGLQLQPSASPPGSPFGVRVRAKPKQTHCGAKFRFEPAATTCAKASRQPATGRQGHILSTWRHTKFPDRSRLVHTAASRRPALSSGEANGWFLAKDLRS
jgi:hypothetical protein